MILTEEELRDLTGFMRSDAQRRELDFMAIPYMQRRDGTLVVLRSGIAQLVSGSAPAPREPQLHL